MKSVLYSSLFLLMVFACSGPEKNTGKELITVSILPQAYFVEKLAGDLVEVNVMVPKGASPATYDPGMAQLAGLEKSIRYIQVGELGFEIGWMDRIRKINPEMKVLNLSLEIDLIETHADSEHEHHGHEELHAHQHGRSDPHIWMSVVNAYPIANIIHRELLEIFPDKRRELESNFQLFMEELDALSLELDKNMQGLSKTDFMIYHPALTYFARDYGLVQHALELDGKRPSPAHLKEMSELAKEKQISLILVQGQFDQKNAEVLSAETGASILAFDPLDPDWKKQMLELSEQFNIYLK